MGSPILGRGRIWTGSEPGSTGIFRDAAIPAAGGAEPLNGGGGCQGRRHSGGEAASGGGIPLKHDDGVLNAFLIGPSEIAAALPGIPSDVIALTDRPEARSAAQTARSQDIDASLVHEAEIASSEPEDSVVLCHQSLPVAENKGRTCLWWKGLMAAPT